MEDVSFGQSKIQRVMWEGKEKTLYPYQGQSLEVKKGEVMVTFSEQKKDVIGNSNETHKICYVLVKLQHQQCSSEDRVQQ